VARLGLTENSRNKHYSYKHAPRKKQLLRKGFFSTNSLIQTEMVTIDSSELEETYQEIHPCAAPNEDREAQKDLQFKIKQSR
jgi:hypothetical protein